MQDDRAHLEAIAEEHGDKLDIVKLNVDENPQVTQKYNILNIPTLGVFSGGDVVGVVSS
jgi:thioredoxin 1